MQYFGFRFQRGGARSVGAVARAQLGDLLLHTRALPHAAFPLATKTVYHHRGLMGLCVRTVYRVFLSHLLHTHTGAETTRDPDDACAYLQLREQTLIPLIGRGFHLNIRIQSAPLFSTHRK